MMQFVDLKAQYEQLKTEIDAGIRKVLLHGKFIMGPEVAELEEKLAAYAGVKHCISVSNGTDALLIPLMAWGVGRGDAVFVPDFTFASTSEVACLTGATPVFVDIDRKTFNMDPQSLEEKILKVKKRGLLVPRVVIPVDLFGLPAEYEKITQIAQRHGLKILEDAAQGLGGKIHEKKAGSFGDAAATSFFPSKPLGCYGDGGAIFTSDDDLAEAAESIRSHGKGKDKYDNVRIGLNARLDTLQAAILLAKLKAFEETELDARNRHAQMYTDGLSECITTPAVPEGYASSWAQYSLLAETHAQRELLQRKLAENHIPTAVYYPRPLHRQTVNRQYLFPDEDYPVADDISERIFSIPMHPYLSMDAIQKIIETIREVNASS
jgi:UDP-2-acetamido-2-deoxy-ribo-hexuluronate aminotransferase